MERRGARPEERKPWARRANQQSSTEGGRLTPIDIKPKLLLVAKAIPPPTSSGYHRGFPMAWRQTTDRGWTFLARTAPTPSETARRFRFGDPRLKR